MRLVFISIAPEGLIQGRNNELGGNTAYGKSVEELFCLLKLNEPVGQFPVMLDMFDMCSKDLQEKLVPMRTK